MKILKFIFLLIAFIFLSCNGNDEYILPPKYVSKGPFDSGFLVLNQGNMTQNATLSFISFDLYSIKNNILPAIISNPNIGLNATDIGLNGDLAYIVSSSDNKIEIVNRYSMEKIGTISTGLNNPKYIAFLNGKAYVTNWGNPAAATDDYVAVINLGTNQIVNSITVNEGPGRILVNNNKLYIAQTGGTNVGSSVIVLNEATNAVTTIAVGENPNTMQIDNGFLWVLCEGNKSAATESTGVLYKVNMTTDLFTDSYQFPISYTVPTDLTSPKIYQHPSNL